MSTAAMEDNFDISTRSRQRDKDVLAAANRAIVSNLCMPCLERGNLEVQSDSVLEFETLAVPRL